MKLAGVGPVEQHMNTQEKCVRMQMHVIKGNRKLLHMREQGGYMAKWFSYSLGSAS